MDILFHVDPLIELGRPYWKVGWATGFSADIIRTLRSSSSGGEHRFCVAVSEPVDEHLVFTDDVRRAVFTQPELLRDFQGSALSASLAWYRGDFTAGQLEGAARLVRERLAGFTPDVVIAFSPAPFLSRAFPGALILQMEYGFLSRPPYPATWYLDPAGMLASSFVARFAGRIAAQPVDEGERRLLEGFKERCRSLLLSTSPYRSLLARERERFRHLVLLPLQFSGFYGFDGNVPFRSQYEYLTHVLEAVPPSVGVVVTTHPEHPVLEHEAVRYLGRRYPHFVFHEEFEDFYSASQFILADVDGVVTVSSSVGQQALLLDKKLITLGRCHVPEVSDAMDLSDLPRLLDSPLVDRSPLLLFLLTRYCIPKGYLNDPEWLDPFLRRSLARFRAGGVDADFFDPIASPEELFRSLAEGIDPDVPKPRREVSPRVAVRRQEAVIEDLTVRLCRAETKRDALLASRSWRITRPLRGWTRLINRLLGKAAPPG